jgi:trehalose 6-phosphate synthase/phosphatase
MIARRHEDDRQARVRLLLDYDGTLVPIAKSPDLAVPDAEVIALLDALGRQRELCVAIVSGRARSSLDSWLGHLPIALWAEHGFWYRTSPGKPWLAARSLPPDWMHDLIAVLSGVTASTPGSFLERKAASVAWHYRLAEPTVAAREAHVLRKRLHTEFDHQPFDLLEGKKVIEVRLRGVSKALVADRIAAEPTADMSIVAIGDDRTDEELFRALPDESVTVAVGNYPSRARYRLADYRAVRRMLRSILEDPRLVTNSLGT